MADVCGQVRSLTVLTPIVRGREAALRELLEALPRDAQSPLARIGGTHFARWVLVPGLLDGEPETRLDTSSEHLLFTSTFDEPVDVYLAELRSLMSEEADAVWGHCDGYPGSEDPAAFSEYMDRHRLRTNLLVAAYGEANLSEVRRALERRRRLRAFAPRAQGMEPAELQVAFREEFTP